MVVLLILDGSFDFGLMIFEDYGTLRCYVDSKTKT